MDMITIIIIAIGLALDCFAVSIASGVTIKNLKLKRALRIPIFFGSFQAIMALIGWLAASSFAGVISDIDHWIAFALLSFIGCRMIHESVKKESDKKEFDPLKLNVLLILSIATSIDSLAVGVSFAFLQISIIAPIIIIGVASFLFSLGGVFIGTKVGHFFEKKIEFVGGLILIGIGIKILVEHLF